MLRCRESAMLLRVYRRIILCYESSYVDLKRCEMNRLFKLTILQRWGINKTLTLMYFVRKMLHSKLKMPSCSQTRKVSRKRFSWHQTTS